jgi:hypothetical protein
MYPFELLASISPLFVVSQIDMLFSTFTTVSLVLARGAVAQKVFAHFMVCVMQHIRNVNQVLIHSNIRRQTLTPTLNLTGRTILPPPVALELTDLVSCSPPFHFCRG